MALQALAKECTAYYGAGIDVIAVEDRFRIPTGADAPLHPDVESSIKDEKLPYNRDILFASMFHGKFARVATITCWYCFTFRELSSPKILECWLVFNKYFTSGLCHKVNVSADNLGTLERPFSMKRSRSIFESWRESVMDMGLTIVMEKVRVDRFIKPGVMKLSSDCEEVVRMNRETIRRNKATKAFAIPLADETDSTDSTYKEIESMFLGELNEDGEDTNDEPGGLMGDIEGDGSTPTLKESLEKMISELCTAETLGEPVDESAEAEAEWPSEPSEHLGPHLGEENDIEHNAAMAWGPYIYKYVFNLRNKWSQEV